MKGGPGRVCTSMRWLEAAGWDRFAARAGDLFRFDESRQHSPAGCGRDLHPVSSRAACSLSGLERPTRSPDVLCRLRLSDYFDHAAALGIVGAGQPARLLSPPLCADCAAAVFAAGDFERTTPGGNSPFRGVREHGWVGEGAAGSIYVSHQRSGGAPRISARQLGHSVVAVGGGSFLPLFPYCLQDLWTRPDVVRDSDRTGRARPIGTHGVRAWQRSLGGIFLSGRNGRHRAWVSDRADRFTESLAAN